MNTKTPLALAASALLLLGMTACNRNADPNGGATNTPAADAAMPDAAPMPTPPPADTVPPADAAAPSQAEALALLNAINDHEVKAAEQAKSKRVTGDVLAYANMMAAEHGKNMADTKAMLDKSGPAPADTPRMAEMTAKSEAALAQLGALEGDAYAKGYIDAMVNDHQDALTRLDTMLIPAATDAAIKAQLTTTRDHVQKHLERAKEIQAKLGTPKA
ncbi:MAG: DUF4142 domain-containing protein [Lysobacter sp.]|nr:MAG: DUF4142 domain-containing protein [Lysobacter sp.]